MAVAVPGGRRRVFALDGHSAGQVITGAVVSSTVIVWMQVLALPQLSVAVQVRVMTTAQGSVL